MKQHRRPTNHAAFWWSRAKNLILLVITLWSDNQIKHTWPGLMLIHGWRQRSTTGGDVDTSNLHNFADPFRQENGITNKNNLTTKSMTEKRHPQSNIKRQNEIIPRNEARLNQYFNFTSTISPAFSRYIDRYKWKSYEIRTPSNNRPY